MLCVFASECAYVRDVCVKLRMRMTVNMAALKRHRVDPVTVLKMALSRPYYLLAELCSLRASHIKIVSLVQSCADT